MGEGSCISWPSSPACLSPARHSRCSCCDCCFTENGRRTLWTTSSRLTCVMLNVSFLPSPLLAGACRALRGEQSSPGAPEEGFTQDEGHGVLPAKGHEASVLLHDEGDDLPTERPAARLFRLRSASWHPGAPGFPRVVRFTDYTRPSAPSWRMWRSCSDPADTAACWKSSAAPGGFRDTWCCPEGRFDCEERAQQAVAGDLSSAQLRPAVASQGGTRTSASSDSAVSLFYSVFTLVQTRSSPSVRSHVALPVTDTATDPGTDTTDRHVSLECRGPPAEQHEASTGTSEDKGIRTWGAKKLSADLAQLLLAHQGSQDTSQRAWALCAGHSSARDFGTNGRASRGKRSRSSWDPHSPDPGCCVDIDVNVDQRHGEGADCGVVLDKGEVATDCVRGRRTRRDAHLKQASPVSREPGFASECVSSLKVSAGTVDVVMADAALKRLIFVAKSLSRDISKERLFGEVSVRRGGISTHKTRREVATELSGGGRLVGRELVRTGERESDEVPGPASHAFPCAVACTEPCTSSAVNKHNARQLSFLRDPGQANSATGPFGSASSERCAVSCCCGHSELERQEGQLVGSIFGGSAVGRECGTLSPGCLSEDVQGCNACFAFASRLRGRDVRENPHGLSSFQRLEGARSKVSFERFLVPSLPLVSDIEDVCFLLDLKIVALRLHAVQGQRQQMDQLPGFSIASPSVQLSSGGGDERSPQRVANAEVSGTGDCYRGKQRQNEVGSGSNEDTGERQEDGGVGDDGDPRRSSLVTSRGPGTSPRQSCRAEGGASSKERNSVVVASTGSTLLEPAPMPARAASEIAVSSFQASLDKNNSSVRSSSSPPGSSSVQSKYPSFRKSSSRLTPSSQSSDANTSLPPRFPSRLRRNRGSAVHPTRQPKAVSAGDDPVRDIGSTMRRRWFRPFFSLSFSKTSLRGAVRIARLSCGLPRSVEDFGENVVVRAQHRYVLSDSLAVGRRERGGSADPVANKCCCFKELTERNFDRRTADFSLSSDATCCSHHDKRFSHGESIATVDGSYRGIREHNGVDSGQSQQRLTETAPEVRGVQASDHFRRPYCAQCWPALSFPKLAGADQVFHSSSPDWVQDGHCSTSGDNEDGEDRERRGGWRVVDILFLQGGFDSALGEELCPSTVASRVPAERRRGTVPLSPPVADRAPVAAEEPSGKRERKRRWATSGTPPDMPATTQLRISSARGSGGTQPWRPGFWVSWVPVSRSPPVVDELACSSLLQDPPAEDKRDNREKNGRGRAGQRDRFYNSEEENVLNGDRVARSQRCRGRVEAGIGSLHLKTGVSFLLKSSEASSIVCCRTDSKPENLVEEANGADHYANLQSATTASLA